MGSSEMPSLFPCYQTDSKRIPTWFGVVLWSLVTLAMVAWHWGKMPSFWGDSPRWLFECWRTSLGEMPYRDFTWQYPPLGLWAVAIAFRLFGATFQVAHAVMAVVALGIMITTWRLARKIMPELLSLVVPTVVLCKEGTFMAGVNFFSLGIYTPSMPFNILGLSLFLLGAIGYLQEANGLSKKRLALMAIGSLVVCLSKPEAALAQILCFVFLFFADRYLAFRDRPIREWLGFYIVLGLWCYLPATLIYIGYGAMVGFKPMIEGITGYGQANLPCPLWPTGRGLTSLACYSALGIGVAALGALLCSLGRSEISNKHRWMLILVFVAGFLLWLPEFIPDLLEGGKGEFVRAIIRFITYAPLSTSAKWLSLFLLPYLIALLLKGRRDAATTCSISVGLVLVAMVAISLRYLFSELNGPYPRDAPPGVTIFAVLNGYLLLYGILFFLRKFGGEGASNPDVLKNAEYVATAILVVLTLIGITNTVRKGNSAQYVEIATEAGKVRVIREDTLPGHPTSGDVSAALYDYVMKHTKPDDYVLDIDYGGCINFATRRRGPIYSTQFAYLKPTKPILDADLKAIQEKPPVFIIVLDKNIHGVYGIDRPIACPCPQFVWLPTKFAHDPSFHFPVLEYIKANYHQTDVVGEATKAPAYIYRKN